MASSSLQQKKCNQSNETGNIALRKGTWSSEEDQVLREYVIKYGIGKWDSLRKKTKLARDGRSCRLRWLNHLNPILKKCSFNEEEGRKLVHLYNELGSKWCQMVSQFPGRTDNELKNFINSKKRSLKNSRKHLIRERINQVYELNKNVGQNNASQEEAETALPRMEFDHQVHTLQGNYLLDQNYGDKNINNFQQFPTLADDSSMLYNHVVPTLDDKSSPRLAPFPSGNMSFDRDFPPISEYYPDNLNMDYPFPKEIHSNKYLQNPDLSNQMLFEDFPPIPQHHPDNLDMVPKEMRSNKYLQNPDLSNQMFFEDFPPIPQHHPDNLDMVPKEMCSNKYLQNPDLSNQMLFEDFPPIPQHHPDNLDMVPKEMRSNKYLQNPDLSNQMFFEDFPPIPQHHSDNLDMDYPFPKEMHSNQYLQNPDLSFEEPQFEIFSPWLLSECVPLW
ncbi:transcription factor MYB35 [Lathyrus oleraceus]|uniref:Uncharacterized protein n=1 Tax=Pisum sativum TaxID=3888 RepID=A0A9D4Y7Z2_PEA|nr:transcription factor MYB35-like [Pisum sativum]XP_050908187.1 transcription factor MYB35-like [Pisum sativum]KAI5433472.1 hypothetical protein KIW84_020667 [Pisum sativum]KAI5433473.1 hypothetical protein KIW84_020668 [Pisum sativum]